MIMNEIKSFKDLKKFFKQGGTIMSDKIDELIKAAKLNELVKKEEPKKTNPLVYILAGIGICATLAAIVYGLYCFFTPDYVDDFDDDLDDDFDDDYFVED